MRNSSEIEEIVHCELKVCERCGALWFRAAGTAEIHCQRCRAQLRNYLRELGTARLLRGRPAGLRRRKSSRRPK